jgi:hypothetical protein
MDKKQKKFIPRVPQVKPAVREYVIEKAVYGGFAYKIGRLGISIDGSDSKVTGIQILHGNLCAIDFEDNSRMIISNAEVWMRK